MNETNREFEGKVIKRLDSIVKLLEDLFILEASKAKVNRQEIRKILGIAMERINRISKFSKSPKD